MNVFEGWPFFPNIVVSCVDDTKPAHFISTSTESITWFEKKILVFYRENNNFYCSSSCNSINTISTTLV